MAVPLSCHSSVAFNTYMASGMYASCLDDGRNKGWDVDDGNSGWDADDDTTTGGMRMMTQQWV